MSIPWMLFNFHGRINRRDWWIATTLLGLAFLFGRATIYNASYPGTGAEGILNLPEPLAATFLSLLFLWPWLALAVKRAHDRDVSGLPVAAVMILVFGISYVPDVAPKLPDVAAVILGLISLAGVLYQLVTLGFLPGNAARNRFG